MNLVIFCILGTIFPFAVEAHRGSSSDYLQTRDDQVEPRSHELTDFSATRQRSTQSWNGCDNWKRRSMHRRSLPNGLCIFCFREFARSSSVFIFLPLSFCLPDLSVQKDGDRKREAERSLSLVGHSRIQNTHNSQARGACHPPRIAPAGDWSLTRCPPHLIVDLSHK